MVLQRFLVLHNSENYIQKSTKIHHQKVEKLGGEKSFFFTKIDSGQEYAQ